MNYTNSPLEEQIYVVGDVKLQNELIAGFLNKHTGATCLAIEDIQLMYELDDSNGSEQRMVLLDFFGKNLQSSLIELNTVFKVLLERPKNILALFNLKPDEGIEFEALKLGVRGFFYELEEPDIIVKGIKAVLKGEIWLTRKIMSECLMQKETRSSHSRDKNDLTDREVQILNLILCGSTNNQIADELFISPHTVKTHLYNIFKKISVPNRLQAALWATKNL